MPHPTLDCTPVSKLEQYVQREEPHILFSVFLLFFVPSTFFDLYEINRSCPTTVFSHFITYYLVLMSIWYSEYNSVLLVATY